MQRCQYSYFTGQELANLERDMANVSDALLQLKQENALSWNQIFQQSVANLLEPTQNRCCLLGKAYNEERSLPLLQKANDRTGLHYFYTNKLILCYLFGEYEQALENAELSMKDISVIKTHNPFAVNDIYFCREMDIEWKDMNNYGSSIIYGHPQAPTMMRIIIELIEELVEKGGGYGLADGCAAGDTGSALILEINID